MRIELLVEDQWQRYQAVRLRALRDTPNAFASTYADEEAFLEKNWRRRLTSGAQTFIAVLGDKDVGSVTGAARRDRDGVAGLFGMWVAPEARGRGAGSLLVQRVIDWASAAGFEQVFLDVADSNHAAIKLYEKAGFRPTGTVGALPSPRENVTEHERSLSLR
ncbi:GNAT family N-acetyltransferase [Roseibium sp. HPY-6]|uniref:GNAT family N-acetyltransferase n=1 Tax=Roseibium sp. HPY-6 TaxID=3229852 RepID=UPI00338D64AA